MSAAPRVGFATPEQSMPAGPETPWYSEFAGIEIVTVVALFEPASDAFVTLTKYSTTVPAGLGSNPSFDRLTAQSDALAPVATKTNNANVKNLIDLIALMTKDSQTPERVRAA